MNQLDLFNEKASDDRVFTWKKEERSSVQAAHTSTITFSWKELVQRVWHLVRVPLIALKHQIWVSLCRYWETRPFPWFRLALLLLFLYILFAKDMRFQINMRPSAQVISTAIPTVADKGTAFSVAALPVGQKETTKEFAWRPSEVEAYRQRFAKVAQIEAQKFGVPASIKMAQALLATRAGTNELATTLNNHFAMPCEDQVTCQSWRNGNVRTFINAWESWRSHSHWLSKQQFASEMNGNRNFREWASALDAAGLADGSLLVKIIERYQLQELDAMNK